MKAITTRYVGPTDTRGARIVASDGDGNRVSIPYPHDARYPHREAVRALCAKMKWRGLLMSGETKIGMVFVWVEPDSAAFNV